MLTIIYLSKNSLDYKFTWAKDELQLQYYANAAYVFMSKKIKALHNYH